MVERRQSPQEVINYTGGAIALVLMAILAFVTWALVRWTIPSENENALMFLLGQLTALMSVVVAFYFGGSATQKKQAETIDTLAKSNAQAQTPSDVLKIEPGEEKKVVGVDSPTS